MAGTSLEFFPHTLSLKALKFKFSKIPDGSLGMFNFLDKKGTDVTNATLLTFFPIEHRHDAWSYNSHLAIMRKGQENF